MPEVLRPGQEGGQQEQHEQGGERQAEAQRDNHGFEELRLQRGFEEQRQDTYDGRQRGQQHGAQPQAGRLDGGFPGAEALFAELFKEYGQDDRVVDHDA